MAMPDHVLRTLNDLRDERARIDQAIKALTAAYDERRKKDARVAELLAQRPQSVLAQFAKPERRA